MGWMASRRVIAGLIALGVLMACNLQFGASPPDTAGTHVAQTISALRTTLAVTPTPSATPETPTPTPLAHAPIRTPAPSPTAGPAVVKITALCWTGPGKAYPVVSGIKARTEVKVLGVGSKQGWLVVENPTYHDRCWIESSNLEMGPHFNAAALPVFNPPPTPGPTPTPKPEPTE